MITRGLATALLVIAIPTLTEIRAEALTVNDLKSYLGYTVEKTQRAKEIVNDKKSNQDRIKELALSINHLNSDNEDCENKIEQYMSNGTSANMILSLINQIDTNNDSLNDQINEKNTISNIESTINSALQISKNMGINMSIDIQSSLFDIGYIGDNAISPVKGLLQISKPFGYKVNSDGSHESKNTGLDLKATAGSLIVAQWNGEVANVETDEQSKTQTVTLFHGNNVYTVYSNIESKNLIIGQYIEQGKLLGTAKNNSIHFQLLVDGKYVNPLLIYGSRGKKLYEDWYNKTHEVYTVEVGEYEFYSDYISTKNPNEHAASNTIDGAATLGDGYVKPNLSVVTGMDK